MKTVGVQLTEHQLDVVKKMTEFAEASANQIYHIMENHGLDKVKGFKFQIDVDPEFPSITKQIEIGCFSNLYDDNNPAGYCKLVAGKGDSKYECLGKNSAEYEWLFADESIKDRMRKILDAGKHPLPPDGMWVSADRNCDPVDGWEWDMNDSLS